MEFLSPEETADRLPYTQLADSIREVALSGRAHAPPRLTLPLPEDGSLLVMPAADGDIAITKLVTIHPRNRGRGLPTIQGEVVVMQAASGLRLGVLDGAAVTARRTAALSMLAAREFAQHSDGMLLIVGAGTQGRAHLEAFREGLGVSKVFITSRTTESAEALTGYAKSLGMEARTVGGPGDVLDEASLIVTATTSREPVLPEDVPDGIFVAAVGAFTPEMAEIPPALISRSTIIVDTLEGAKDEAGDLLDAERAGVFRWEDATPLEEALRWSGPPGGTAVFKSVGHALWDLAAARTAFLPRA